MFKINKVVMALVLIVLTSTTAASNQQHPNSILILGDSISAAYGIDQEKSWPMLLQQTMDRDFAPKSYQVINASISGETTGGALNRLPKLLAQHQPTIVIVELGGNDGLRGFPITTLRKNLDRIAVLSLQHQAKVLLTGMRIPPNYGPRYTQQFYDSYNLTAKKHQLMLVPFILEEIATRPELMQRDGIHPTAEAQPLILKNVLPYLKSIL
jgi:acyl-CoA thioesterase-1